MVLGLMKADSQFALLQISIYRSLEDWISLLEDVVVAACVLSEASDTCSRMLVTLPPFLSHKNCYTAVYFL
ncbi:hypothetical protein Bca52824_047386 [Brassica carinata]|uniref:Uncharacterized protein n=1 Tax=Brassica carinata TaxID=52824 RepID=A0A8X7RGX9_BRACI|nr:hypothetical protein Bca52824_047386 [Brassica carinata]